MSPNPPLQRPQRQNNSSVNRPYRPSPRTQHSSGNGSGNSGNRGGGNRSQPSPWLDPDREPVPNATASFVEYLRWMREPDHQHKDATKVQILHLAQENANYRDRLKQLTQRTQLIAGQDNTFEVNCPWRIRVGGHRGPESILLPAFDALGMPFIPSSTLRGVARSQAIREVMAQKQINWQEAQQHVAAYFGSLDAQPADQAGKVIFLDAYPLPSSSGGLAMDMANNIWKWDNNRLDYSPNPNPFFSLKKPTFLIGLRLASGYQDPQVLQQVKRWLIAGLHSGIGSQVNTGYGELIKEGSGKSCDEFSRVGFSLEGQLIHGCQKFSQWRWNDRRHQWDMRGTPEAEVRPTAFKSMLRYWFRVFALGVLKPEVVQTWEANLFGAIAPTATVGWVRVNILSGKVTQKEPRKKNDPCGEQEGILTLAYSVEAPPAQQAAIAQLCQNLTWLMVNLGGIGQGARRPCYSRQTRDRAPWYRGSTFYLNEAEAAFWDQPESVKPFGQLFQKRLQDFYQALTRLSNCPINPRHLLEASPVGTHQWEEVADKHCQIVAVTGNSNTDKPYALEILHNRFHQLEGDRVSEAKSLCGGTRRDSVTVNGGQIRRDVVPSPVWIADLGDYQVVTVFGATANPRQAYLKELRRIPSYAQIFPFE